VTRGGDLERTRYAHGFACVGVDWVVKTDLFPGVLGDEPDHAIILPCDAVMFLAHAGMDRRA